MAKICDLESRFEKKNVRDIYGNIMVNNQYLEVVCVFFSEVDRYVTIYIMLYPFMVTKQEIYHSTWITWLYIDENMELKPIRAIVKTLLWGMFIHHMAGILVLDSINP